MKRLSLIMAAILTLAVSCSQAPQESMGQLIDRVFDVAAQQAKLMSSSLGETETPKTFENGEFVKAPYDW